MFLEVRSLLHGELMAAVPSLLILVRPGARSEGRGQRSEVGSQIHGFCVGLNRISLTNDCGV